MKSPMRSNLDTHRNNTLEAQLKLASNNKIPLHLFDCFKPAEEDFFTRQAKSKHGDVILAVKNQDLTSTGNYIGYFGFNSEYHHKEYVNTLESIKSQAKTLNIVSPVFDLLTIPDHSQLAQYLTNYNEVCRVYGSDQHPKLLPTLTECNFLPIDVKKYTKLSDVDGETMFIQVFGSDYRVSPEIKQCILNHENLAFFLDVRMGQFYTLPIEALKVLLDISAVVSHNLETLAKAKCYDQDLRQQAHKLRCDEELNKASKNLKTKLLYRVTQKPNIETHLIVADDAVINGTKYKAGQTLCKSRKCLNTPSISLRLGCATCREIAGLEPFNQ